MNDLSYCVTCSDKHYAYRPSTGYGNWEPNDPNDPYETCGTRMCDECRVEYANSKPSFVWKENADAKAIRRLQRLVADYEKGNQGNVL